jgi:hypothetical protein
VFQTDASVLNFFQALNTPENLVEFIRDDVSDNYAFESRFVRSPSEDDVDQDHIKL